MTAADIIRLIASAHENQQISISVNQPAFKKSILSVHATLFRSYQSGQIGLASASLAQVSSMETHLALADAASREKWTRTQEPHAARGKTGARGRMRLRGAAHENPRSSWSRLRVRASSCLLSLEICFGALRSPELDKAGNGGRFVKYAINCGLKNGGKIV